MPGREYLVLEVSRHDRMRVRGMRTFARGAVDLLELVVDAVQLRPEFALLLHKEALPRGECRGQFLYRAQVRFALRGVGIERSLKC